MTRVPQPPNSLGDVIRWAREIVDCLLEREPADAPNTLLSRTTRGTARSALGVGGGIGEDGKMPMIKQWDPLTDYKESDLAFCDTDGERDDGNLSGLFQCISDKSGDAGNGEPVTDATHWKMVARANWKQITYADSTVRIRISVTDSGWIKMLSNTGDESQGAVYINLADIPSGAGDKMIKLREETLCTLYGLKNITWLASDIYDPPS